MRSETATFTATARRDQIVGATIKVLTRDGFAATSFAAIAESIGVSKGVIAYHFASKDQLLRQVVTAMLTRATAEIAPAVAAQAEPAAALQTYLEAHFTHLAAHPASVIALVEVLNGLPPDNGLYDAGEVARLLAVLIEAGQRSGAFRSDIEPLPTALAIRAAIDAATGLLRNDPAFDLAGYGETVSTLFQRAVAS